MFFSQWLFKLCKKKGFQKNLEKTRIHIINLKTSLTFK